MATGERLKRETAGRYGTADGRFTVEQSSGRWMLVDTEEADDLGLPLVRGPFATLDEAREAIDEARTAPRPASGLAGRVAALPKGRRANRAEKEITRPPRQKARETQIDLREFEPAAMQRLIFRCAELHLNHIATSGDPFEFGAARPLDFGHWSAHKLEQLSEYRIRHGEAVAIGIALDVVYARRMEFLDATSAERILGLLERLGFEDAGSTQRPAGQHLVFRTWRPLKDSPRRHLPPTRQQS